VVNWRVRGLARSADRTGLFAKRLPDGSPGIDRENTPSFRLSGDYRKVHYFIERTYLHEFTDYNEYLKLLPVLATAARFGTLCSPMFHSFML